MKIVSVKHGVTAAFFFFQGVWSLVALWVIIVCGKKGAQLILMIYGNSGNNICKTWGHMLQNS